MRPVVCFGEALIDFLARAPALGRPRTFEQHAGGAPANVAVAIARLGGAAEFAGMLAQDMFGDFLLDCLTAAGVGTRLVRRTAAAPTALAFVALDDQGERSFRFYRPPAADLLFRASDLDDALLAEAAAFHACSNSLTEDPMAAATLAGLERARSGGALASFDVNLRPALWGDEVDPAPPIWRALAAADLVKLSAEELAFLAERAGGEARVLERLWNGATGLVVVTRGAAPLSWHTRHMNGTVAGFRVRTIDTTAAGDAFIGGLLAELASAGIRGPDLAGFAADRAGLEAALRFASACGALATTRHGAFEAMPSRDDVKALLR